MVLDLRMPLVDGLELLRRLRTLPTCHDTPVAIVTGDYFIDNAVLDELFQLGAIVRYKPLWGDDLITLIYRSERPSGGRCCDRGTEAEETTEDACGGSKANFGCPEETVGGSTSDAP
jgi:DNA-binding response OmpR family regulator